MRNLRVVKPVKFLAVLREVDFISKDNPNGVGLSPRFVTDPPWFEFLDEYSS